MFACTPALFEAQAPPNFLRPCRRRWVTDQRPLLSFALHRSSDSDQNLRQISISVTTHLADAEATEAGQNPRNVNHTCHASWYCSWNKPEFQEWCLAPTSVTIAFSTHFDTSRLLINCCQNLPLFEQPFKKSKAVWLLLLLSGCICASLSMARLGRLHHQSI